MLTPIVREDLLYYLWKTKSFDLKNLKTEDGEAIEIIEFGNQNYDAGPDFSNGKIRIGKTIWAGNVEMHVYSSDWERHCHDIDKAYDNVILHVVFEHDKEVFTTTEHTIPCLEMKNRIPEHILENYAQLIANNLWIPCVKHIHKVAGHTILFWLQRLVAERVESKTFYIKKILDQTENNWEETLYIVLCRYMGAKVNKEPFESLAKNLPLSLIGKNKDDIVKIEALFFGQAGMLEANFEDEYFQTLKKEYAFLATKYGLNAIPPVSWKFSRMRPAGFPTIRIAQMAQIVFNCNHLFSKILIAYDVHQLKNLFRAVPSAYWNDHYRFGKESIYREKPVGEDVLNMLIINVVAPMLFLFGKSIGDDQYCDKAIEHLEALPFENNEVIRKYQALGVKCESSADSQALIQLKKSYCDEKRCMSCSIGAGLIG